MLRYHLEIDDLHSHHFRVTLTLPHPAPAQRLSLPVWIPGSYLVREFSRHLSAIEARQEHPRLELPCGPRHRSCGGRSDGGRHGGLVVRSGRARAVGGAPHRVRRPCSERQTG